MAETRERSLEGGNQVGDQTLEVVVVGIQREPADRQAALLKPFANQGALTVPGRSGYKHQPGLDTPVQDPHQALPGNVTSTQ